MLTVDPVAATGPTHHGITSPKFRYCDDQAGLYLPSDERDVEFSMIKKLLTGLPHAMLLRDEHARFSVLVPSGALPMRE
jgi:hypothetical protein